MSMTIHVVEERGAWLIELGGEYFGPLDSEDAAFTHANLTALKLQLDDFSADIRIEKQVREPLDEDDAPPEGLLAEAVLARLAEEDARETKTVVASAPVLEPLPARVPLAAREPVVVRERTPLRERTRERAAVQDRVRERATVKELRPERTPSVQEPETAPPRRSPPPQIVIHAAPRRSRAPIRKH